MKHKKKTKQGLHILFLLILMGILFSSMSVVSFAGTTRTVGNLTDLTTALNEDNVDDVIVSARISLPDNTDLDGKGKTVRVETPYAGTDGKVLSSGFSTGGVFLISGNVTIKNMTVMGGYFSSPGSGGAITINSGTTNLENVTITRSCRGLSIDGIKTKAILKDCCVVRNVAEFGGGALCSGGTLIMDGCSLSENRSLRSNGGGGAMEIKGGYFYANNTVIANNSSTEIGGAINDYDSKLYLMNCTVTGNVTTGHQTNYGGGIGINSNSKQLYAVNSVFVDNYHINGATGTVLTRSDIGFFRWGADGNTYLYNCLYAETQGSQNIPHSTNCKNNEDNFTGMAAAYRNDGILIGKSDNSVGYSHPGLFAKGPGKLYVPIKVSGGAASGGTETYFDYSNPDAIEMGYKDETSSSIVNLGDLKAPGADKQVTKYYEGTNRADGVIGASGTSSENYYTVKLDRNIMDGHVEGATVYGDTYVANTSVKVRAIANSGKKFERWKITGLYDETPNPEYVSANPYTFNVTKDVLLTPEFADSAGTSEVTFYSDMAGTKAISGSLQEVETGTSLSDITPPEDLSRDGFYFAGWSTVKATDTEKGYSYKQAMKDEKECILANFEQGTEETVTGDTNFYPVFIKDRLEVHLDLGAFDTSDGVIAYKFPEGEDKPEWWTTKQTEYAGNTKSTKAQMANKQRRQFTVDIDEKIRMLYVDDDGIIDEDNGMIKATRPGYDLAGWYTAKGVLWNGAEWKEATSKDKWWAMTPEYADGVRQQHTRPYYYYTVTLTAHWTPKNVPVKYSLGKGGTGVIPSDGIASLGSTLTLPAAQAADSAHQFVGWEIGVEGHKTLHSAGEKFTFDDWAQVADGETPILNVTAKYIEKPTCSITFDTDGGSAIEPITANIGESITKPSDPTKSGYTFDGWDPAFPDEMPNENLTLKAKWKVNQYTIKFNMNGATGQIEDIKQNYGISLDDAQKYNKGQSQAPTRKHYEFVGWSPVIPENMPAYNLTVEAIWEPITYRIVFKTDANDSGIEKTGYYGSLVALPDDPVKENLAFVGWKTINGKEVEVPLYMPAQEVSTNPTIIAAQWKPAPGAVNETHSGNNDGKITGVNDEMVYSDDGGTRWKDVQSSQTEITGLPAGKYLVKYKDSGDYKSDKTTIVTIGVNNATISFNTDGGSAIESITTKVGADVTKPADPTKPGYTFAGWEPEFPEKMPANDLILRAKWTKNVIPTPTPEPDPEPTPTPDPDKVTYDDLTDTEKTDADKLAEANGTDKDTAARMLRTGQSLGVSMDTMLLTTSAIEALPDDEDPAGTDFAKLTARAVKRGKTTMRLQWKTLPDADGYLIYTNKCGKTKKYKLKKTVTNGKTNKWNRKKLQKQRYYKHIVVAYKLVGDQKLPIAASVTVHCTTKAKKNTIAKGVKVNKKKITVAVGGTVKLKGKEIKQEKRKIIQRHRAVRYESLNPAVATVEKKTGKITGVSAGTTTIYAYAQNGVYKKIPVTVQ